MRRLVLASALLLFACDKPDAGKADAKGSAKPSEAPTKAEPEPEPERTTAEPEADADAPPPGVKIKGNLPVRTEAELAAEAEARDTCVSKCVESKQAEAKGADAIEADCRAECLEAMPIEQVEVVSDPMPAPQ